MHIKHWTILGALLLAFFLGLVCSHIPSVSAQKTIYGTPVSLVVPVYVRHVSVGAGEAHTSVTGEEIVGFSCTQDGHNTECYIASRYK